jgi:hypothetical protein
MMNSFPTFSKFGLAGMRLRLGAIAPLCILIVLCLWMGRTATAQVVPAGDGGGVNIFAGVTGSGFAVQYGQQKILGVTAFVDANTRRAVGFEGEARWLMFHEAEDVHVTTWLAGPRYHRTMGKIQIYGKGLVGVGEFDFPYNYAHGRYFVVAPGGGVDFTLSHRVRLRLADAEYQYWPQFTFGPMSSFGISTGLRIRVF